MKKDMIVKQIKWVRLQLKNPCISIPTRRKLVQYGKMLQQKYLECCRNEEGKVD